MGVIGGFISLAVMIAAVLIPIFLIRNSRNAYLGTLGKEAAMSLMQSMGPLFDAPPRWRVSDAGKVGAIEGRRHGEAIEIKSDFGDNSSYVGTGYKTSVRGRTTVTIGLRGAKPSFKLVQKDKLANFVEQRFDGDTESSLLDDETKRAIIEYAVMVPMLETIEVTEQGLAISFGNGVLQPTEIAKSSVVEDLKRTLDLAERLQKRFLGTIEKRITEEAHVRVDAYREPATEEADAEEELERRA